MKVMNRQVVRGSMKLAAFVGLGTVLAVGMPAKAAATFWQVQNGDWNVDDATHDNWSAGVPGDGIIAYFTNTADGASLVTLPAGYSTANVSGLETEQGKTVTFQFGNGSTMTGGILTSGANGGPGDAHVTLLGPASGSATANLGRVYDSYNTTAPCSITISGALTVNLTGSYSGAGNGSSLDITNGATVKGTTDGAGKYYIRYSPASRMTVDNGTVSGSLIYVAVNADATGGLLQLGELGHLSANASNTSKLDIQIYKSGRFEAEGSGIDASAVPHIYSGGTLAVGVNPVGGSQTAAKTLTLNGAANFDNGGILEMSLFGNGQNDKIALGSGATLVNGTGSGTVLQLVLGDGYTPHAGDSWTLFSGATTLNLTGKFDLSQIDTTKYNTDDFNQTGGWKITAVPEPGSAGLLIMGLMGVLSVRRRK